MSNFKPTPQKDSKTKNIVLLTVFSLLLFVAIAGIFSRLVRGESGIIEYVPNIILVPVSAFFVIRSSLVLKGKVKNNQIPWTLFLDIVLMISFVFCIGVMVVIFIGAIHEGEFGPMLFAAALCAGFSWSMYFWIKVSKAHWALFSMVKFPAKNAEKKKNTLINCLMTVEQLLFIADVSVESNIPYLDEDGQLCIYDSRNLAEKAVSRLGFNKNILFYVINVIDKKERASYFQKFYDYGFQRIQYVTEMGSIDLPLEDFPIINNSDPIHLQSSQFLVQNYVAMQHRARYAHLKQIGKSENECSSALTNATAHTNISVAAFNSSLFYVFVVPDNIGGDNVLKFSENALYICNKNNFISAMSFEGKITRFMNYPGNLTIPYADMNREQQPFFLVFTKYEKAVNCLDEIKGILTKWEAEASEDIKMNGIKYWNRLKGLSACHICVMTGKEIAEHMMGTTCEFIAVNQEQGIYRNTFEGYLTDSAGNIR